MLHFVQQAEKESGNETYVWGVEKNCLCCCSTQKKKEKAMQKAILEEQIEPIAVQLPALPDNAKETIVKIMPILAIIGLVINGFGLIALLAIGIIAIFALTAGVQVLLGFVFTVATVVLLALALPGLFAKKRAGWVWIYYAELLSIVSSIISLNILNVLFSLLWLYLLFQVRSLYTE
jgi:hypothetical protein